MRELRLDTVRIFVAVGITPACAGITAALRDGARREEDHPRVCGNYALPVPGWMMELGSPPRVRELPAIAVSCPASPRITPACAGITLCNGRATKSA